MTLDDFYSALAACTDQISWHHWSTDIRGHLRVSPNRALIECCPLTAVAYAQTGMPYSIAAPHEAARELGLSPDDAEALIYAADMCSLGDHPALRARLRACVGLPPEGAHDGTRA